MTANVVITKGTSGLMEIELIKGDRIVKSIRFMDDEWQDLVRQISKTKKDLEPVDVLMAKYHRLHNAGANCTPIANLLDSIREAKEDPAGMVEREKLQQMMEVLK